MAHIGYLDKLILNIKKKNLDVENLDILVKILACGVWADGVVKDEELAAVGKIVENIVPVPGDAKTVEDLVIQKIKEYGSGNWVYLQDIDEVLKYILVNRAWNYAEYLIEIFKSDRVISNEEGEIAKQLTSLLESKKFFESKLGIKL